MTFWDYYSYVIAKQNKICMQRFTRFSCHPLNKKNENSFYYYWYDFHLFFRL